MADPADSPFRLAAFSSPLQWLFLAALSGVLAFVLEMTNVPAALLLGPMIGGIVFGIGGATVRAPRPVFVAAQGVIGVLIAGSIEPDMLAGFLARWQLVLPVVIVPLAASAALGAAIARYGSLPGTTAIWGSAPGAASAMVLMAEAFGADARLVAFMQYLRVIIVSLSAALIARLFVDLSGVEPEPVEWFPPLDAGGLAATILVAVGGAVLGSWSRIPGGTFLGPLVLGIALHAGAGIGFQLPEWLLAASYAVVGWSIGLRFTAPILRHAFRALPQILAGIVALIAICGGLAAIIAPLFGVDALSAFLATSPGGMDTVAIVAAATDGVDLSFVMTLQMARFLLVLLAGPPLARAIARRMKGPPP